MHAHRIDTVRPYFWLALAVLLVYFNSLSGAFQFDDYKVIVDNSSVHSWAAWLDGIGHSIRPLLKFSYTLNWTMGAGVTGFHLTNLLIHLLNTLLVFRLAELFVEPLRPDLRGTPLFAALLFAVHPAHTEVVTYICGRSTSLMTLFYLAGMYAYATGRLRQDRFRLHGIVPLMFIAALSVKETAVTFPLALLVWELGYGGSWNKAYIYQWSNWAVLLAGAAFFLFNDSYLTHMERSAELNSLQGNLATQLLAFAYLLRQWALPLWLNIDPDLPLLHGLSESLLPLLFFVTLLALIPICQRKRPWLAFALAWAIVQLVPLHLFLPRLDIANDRQLYLADWPLFLALACEMSIALKGRIFEVAAAALLIALTVLTLSRNRIYADEISLWEATVRQSPHKARVHNNLGYAYKLAGRTEEARREFSLALQIDPTHIKARHNLEYLDEAPLENRPAQSAPGGIPLE